MSTRPPIDPTEGVEADHYFPDPSDPATVNDDRDDPDPDWTVTPVLSASNL